MRYTLMCMVAAKGSFNNYVTLKLPIFGIYLPYVTLCYKLKCTYHRCYVTFRIFLIIVILFYGKQPLSVYIFIGPIQDIPFTINLCVTSSHYISGNTILVKRNSQQTFAGDFLVLWLTSNIAMDDLI